MDKSEKLNKLLELLKTDTITPKEIEHFLTTVAGVIKSSKERFESISVETLREVQSALQYIENEHEVVLSKVENITSEHSEEFKSRLSEIKTILDSLKQFKDGKDGKDGSPGLDGAPGEKGADGSPDTGEEIVSKINDLAISPEFQIDASHIKNLPEATGGRLGSTARNLWQLNDVTITNPTNGQGLSYNSTTRQWENGAGGGASIGGTAGSVLFVNPDDVISEDNAGFFYDDLNNTLKLSNDAEDVYTSREDNNTKTNGTINYLYSGFSPGTGFNNSVRDAVYNSALDCFICGGPFTSYNGTTRNFIAAINPDGSLNSTFDVGTGLNGGISSGGITIEPVSGDIIVCGGFTTYNGATVSRVIKLNKLTGALDTSFSTNLGTVNSQVLKVSFDSNNKYLLAGQFSTVNGVARTRVARLNTDGSLDTGFTTTGTGFNNAIGAMSELPDGRLLLISSATAYDTNTTHGIVILNSDGSFNTTYLSSRSAAFTGFYLYPDGAFLQGGVSLSYYRTNRVNYLFKSDSSFNFDADFSPGANGSVVGIGELGNGNLFLSGAFTVYNGYPYAGIVEVTPDGIPTNGLPQAEYSTTLYNPIHKVILLDGIYYVFGAIVPGYFGCTWRGVVALLPDTLSVEKKQTALNDASAEFTIAKQDSVVISDASGAESTEYYISTTNEGVTNKTLAVRGNGAFAPQVSSSLKTIVGNSSSVTDSPLEVYSTNTASNLSNLLTDEIILLAADRDFSSSSGNWTGTNWTISAGVATHTAPGTNPFSLSAAALVQLPVSGTICKVTLTFTTTTVGTLSVSCGGIAGNGQGVGDIVGTATATFTVSAFSAGSIIITPNATWLGSIDNISLKFVIQPSPQISLGSRSSGAIYSRMLSGESKLYISTQNGLPKNTAGSAILIGGGEILNIADNLGSGVFIGNFLQPGKAYGELIGSSLAGTILIGDNSRGGNFGIGIGGGASVGEESVSMGTTAYAGKYSVTIGHQAGYSPSMSGGNVRRGNIYIGYRVCNDNNTGSYNTIIGYDIDVPVLAGSNQLSIGNLIFGTSVDGTGTTISSGSIGIGTNAPDRRFHTEVSDTATNTITYAERLSHITTGTAAVGFGTGVEHELENASGTNVVASTQETTWTDATNATEDADYVIKTIRNGTLSESLRVTSVGGLKINNAYTMPTADGTSGQVPTTNGAGVVTWATPSGGGTTMAAFTVSNQDYTTNVYTLWGTTPTMSVGTAPTMDANGSLLLPVDTTWKVTVYMDTQLGAAGDYLSFTPFITNTSAGTSQSLTGGAVITPNNYSVGVNIVTPFGVGGSQTPATFVIYIKVGSVAKYLRFDGGSASSSNGTNYQTLTAEKLA